VIFPVVLPAYGLTSQEVVAKLEAAGYSQIREMKAGKIMTYNAVRGRKEALVVDSFGKFKELPYCSRALIYWRASHIIQRLE
jgi:hypothetical protein